MGTKDFNAVDKVIAWLRLAKIIGRLKKNASVLDFGCGHQAYLLRHLEPLIRSGIGIDYDVKNELISQKLKTIQMRFIAKLPFDNEQFDNVVMLAVLEHVDLHLVKNLFDEFYRVLKPNAAIILTTPTPLSKGVLEFLAFRLRVISSHEVGDHKKYYGKKDIEQLAHETGYLVKTYQQFWFGLNSFAVLTKQ